MKAEPKPRNCRHCREPFVPRMPLQVACSPPCALEVAKASKRRRELKRTAPARKAKREYRERTKTIAKLKAEAQREFNRYIRERDHGKSCICCGRFPKSAVFTGGDWDAGHFRSIGAADHLRFNEDNCHAQMKTCNRDASGNHSAYRIGLIARIGLARVEALENDNRTVKWDRDELVAIRRTYLGKWKALKAAREARA